MTNYTHEKRPYLAECIQWDGKNTDRVQEMMGVKVRLNLYPPLAGRTDGPYLMVRTPDGGIFTMTPSWWIVKGENSVVKCYPDEAFKIKYRKRVVPTYQD